MLWYKAWLETRWRALLPLGMLYWVLFQANAHGNLQFAQGSLLVGLPVFWMLVPLMLAGSGIRTEAPFRPVKGLEGSIYFTLALPVSRLRLFFARVAFGITGTAVFVVALCCLGVVAFPKVGTQFTLADGSMYAVTIVLCCLAVFGISTFFATFLDQQWQVFATMAAGFLLRYVPFAKDVFRAMGVASPLVTHTLPWPEIGISLGMGAVCLVAAAIVVQMREY